ncbi:hypothetical protein D3C79_407810 [compost metagenome]
MQALMQVVHHSDVLFVKEVVAAIEAGYMMDNTFECVPTMVAGVNRVSLKPGKAKVLVEHTAQDITVTAYDPYEFLIKVQDAVIQGFRLLDAGIVMTNTQRVARFTKAPVEAPEPVKEEVKVEPKVVVEKAPEAAVEAPKPVSKKAAKKAGKALVAEPTLAELETTSTEEAE